MSKLFEDLASRLICVGGAKLCTNAGSGDTDELDNGARYD